MESAVRDDELTPEAREQLRLLLHNQRVWDAWFFGSLLVALAGLIGFGLWVIRNDTQRAVDLSVVRTVAQVKAEMERLRLEQIAADRERAALQRTVEPLKELPKAVEQLKGAVESGKVEGRP
jgi:cell division protein FtsB